MGDLDGNGQTITLADGPHTIRFRTRRMAILEKRYGGLTKMQAHLQEDEAFIELLGALLWAAGKGETEEEAMDAADGTTVAPLLRVLFEEYTRAFAGEDALEEAKKAQAEAEKSNGQAADPTPGASPQTSAPLTSVPSLSMS